MPTSQLKKQYEWYLQAPHVSLPNCVLLFSGDHWSEFSMYHFHTFGLLFTINIHISKQCKVSFCIFKILCYVYTCTVFFLLPSA